MVVVVIMVEMEKTEGRFTDILTGKILVDVASKHEAETTNIISTKMFVKLVP